MQKSKFPNSLDNVPVSLRKLQRANKILPTSFLKSFLVRTSCKKNWSSNEPSGFHVRESWPLDDVAHVPLGWFFLSFLSFSLFLSHLLSRTPFSFVHMYRDAIYGRTYAFALDDVAACAITVCISYDSQRVKRRRRQRRCRFLENEVVRWLSLNGSVDDSPRLMHS